MEYLKVWTSFLEIMEPLSDDERGRLFTAMLTYAETGEEPELSGNERYVWPSARQSINNAREKSEQMKANGSKQKQTRAKESKPKQQEAKPSALFDKDNNKDNKENTTLTGSTKEKRTRFSPPTVDEVAQYCKERGNKVDAQRFVDFYASKGWRVGQNPMKDWRACVRTWEQRDSGQTAQKPRILRAQDYQQRDYSEGTLADALGVDALFREAAG